MPRSRLYCDLDNTLIMGVQNGNQIHVIVRPGAVKFLKRLAAIGDLWLMTHGVRSHARESLRVMGTRPLFKGILSREDYGHLVPGDKPIAPPGFIFDDFPVGSWLYDLKATALGINRGLWIEVEPFAFDKPDTGALSRAYHELVRRVSRKKTA